MGKNKSSRCIVLYIFCAKQQTYEMDGTSHFNRGTGELKSEAEAAYTRYDTFKQKMIPFGTTSSSHRIVDTSNHGSQPTQKVSSKRVLTPYQKSFFFRWWMVYFFWSVISDFSRFSMDFPKLNEKQRKNIGFWSFSFVFHWFWWKSIKNLKKSEMAEQKKSKSSYPKKNLFW